MTAQRGVDPEPYIRRPRLTGEHEIGGLFGFRFKAKRQCMGRPAAREAAGRRD
ncbi:hypothetical protein [Streptomyces sp. NPDC058385]|uniref:hypothetical protein n=1 Tax=Streptomyces sp. NPDC058385 TaxID=3346473 RepID=UPI00366487E4